MKTKLASIRKERGRPARDVFISPSRFGPENLDIEMESGSPVSEEYRPPFAYTGVIRKVQIHIAPSTLSASEQEKVRTAERDAVMAME